MKLLVQSCYSLITDLLHHISLAPESSVILLILFTESHETTENINKYKITLLIVSGFEVTTVILYLKKIIYNYNTCILQVCQLHLI